MIRRRTYECEIIYSQCYVKTNHALVNSCWWICSLIGFGSSLSFSCTSAFAEYCDTAAALSFVFFLGMSILGRAVEDRLGIGRRVFDYGLRYPFGLGRGSGSLWCSRRWCFPSEEFAVMPIAGEGFISDELNWGSREKEDVRIELHSNKNGIYCWPFVFVLFSVRSSNSFQNFLRISCRDSALAVTYWRAWNDLKHSWSIVL